MNDTTHKTMIVNLLKKKDLGLVLEFFMNLYKMSSQPAQKLLHDQRNTELIELVELLIETGVLSLLVAEYLVTCEDQRACKKISKLLLMTSYGSSYYVNHLVQNGAILGMFRVLEHATWTDHKLRHYVLGALANVVADGTKTREHLIDLGLPGVLERVIKGKVSENWNERTSILFLSLMNNIIRLKPLPSAASMDLVWAAYSRFLFFDKNSFLVQFQLQRNLAQTNQEALQATMMDIFYHTSWGLCFLSESPLTINYLIQQKNILHQLHCIFTHYMFSFQIFIPSESISISLLRCIGNLLVEENYRQLVDCNVDLLASQLALFLRLSFNRIKKEVCWIYSNISCYRLLDTVILKDLIDLFKSPDTGNSIRFEIAWIFLNTLLFSIESEASSTGLKSSLDQLSIPRLLQDYTSNIDNSLVQSELVVEFNMKSDLLKSNYNFYE